MFSCVNIRDQAAAIVPGGSGPPGNPPRSAGSKYYSHDLLIQTNYADSEGPLESVEDEHHDHEGEHKGYNISEREMLDRVLEEGIRLKTKCKQLRFTLLQQEQFALEERQAFSQKIDDMQLSMETTIAEMRAKHFLEITHVRDHRINELAEQQERIATQEQEIAQLQNLTTTYQEQLLQAHAQRQALEEELQAERYATANDTRYTAGYKDGLQFQKDEVQQLLEERRRFEENLQIITEENLKLIEEKDSIQEQLAQLHHSLNARYDSNLHPHISDNTVSGKAIQNKEECASCAQYQLRLQEAYGTVEDLRCNNIALQDDRQHFYEETCRLEKQVNLLKIEVKDLESRGLSPQYHLHHTSDKEKRLLHELQTAKAQITELNHALEALLLSKADVEDAVQSVTEDNRRLASELHKTNHQSKPIRSAPINDSRQHTTESKNEIPFESVSLQPRAVRTQQKPITMNTAATSRLTSTLGNNKKIESRDSSPGYRERCMFVPGAAAVAEDHPHTTQESSTHSVASIAEAQGDKDHLQIDVSMPLPSPASTAADTPRKHLYQQQQSLPMTTVPIVRRNPLNIENKNHGYISSSKHNYQQLSDSNVKGLNSLEGNTSTRINKITEELNNAKGATIDPIGSDTPSQRLLPSGNSALQNAFDLTRSYPAPHHAHHHRRTSSENVAMSSMSFS